MFKKLFMILIFLTIIYLGFAHKTWFIEIMKSGGSFAIMVSIVFVSILVFFPVVPFVVVAGMIGITYGTWEGTAITLSGAMLGTMVMFIMTRYGFSAWALQTIQNYPKLKEYESSFEQHGFISVFIARLIPIIPTPVVNILSGLSKISWVTFFIASLLGKLPSNLMYNFAGSELQTNKIVSVFIYGGYAVVVFIGLFIYNFRKTNKRRFS